MVSGQKEEKEKHLLLVAGSVCYVITQVKLRSPVTRWPVPSSRLPNSVTLQLLTFSCSESWESWRRISTRDGRDDVVQNVNSIRADPDTFCNREDISECINEIAPFDHRSSIEIFVFRHILFFRVNFYICDRSIIRIEIKEGNRYEEWLIYGRIGKWQIIVESEFIFRDIFFNFRMNFYICNRSIAIIRGPK